MILVSGCLLGINCKYNGGSNLSEEILAHIKTHGGIPVCPEQLGGLTTPRVPAEIFGGAGADVLKGSAQVRTKDGCDVTSAFITGAEESLKIAKAFNITKAVLKARSPSCGVGKIYDGSFSGTTSHGDGVTAALLKENGIEVYTEENFLKGNS